MATWRQNLPRTRRVNLYEVLDDPDHPAFLDLGRLLWTLVTTQRQWVYRRVETVTPVGRRSFRRHLSIDGHVPADVVGLAGDLGLDRFPVPLRILRKAPLLAFDLRLDNQAVPLLTRHQNGMATLALLYAAVEQLGRPVSPDLDEALLHVATDRGPAAGTALKLLGLIDGDPDPAAAPGGGGAVGELAGMAPTLVRWAVATLDRSFLLLADVAVQRLDHRVIFKITDESQTWPGQERLRSKIGWHPTAFVFDTPDVVAAGSYHFEFRAPPGLVATDGALVAVAADDEGEEGGEAEGFGEAESRGPVLGLVARREVPEALSYNAEVCVRTAPEGLLYTSLLSSAVASGTLLLASALVGRLDPGQPESAIALILLLPGVTSAFFARPTEHALVSRLFRGIRALVLVSAFAIFAAAGALVVDLSELHLRLTWLGLGLVSSLTTAALAVAARLSAKAVRASAALSP